MVEANKPTIDDAGSIDIPVGQTYQVGGVPHTHEGLNGGGGVSVSIIAGAGLTGGGVLSVSRILDVGAGTLIGVTADAVNLANGTEQYQIPVTGATPFTPAYVGLGTFAGTALNFTSGAFHLDTPGTLTATSINEAVDAHTHAIDTTLARSAVTIGTTSPLAGGGDLTANRTLSIAGLTSLGTGNYVVGVNAGATAWEYKQLIEGTNVTITHGVGTITIASTGGLAAHDIIGAYHTVTGAAYQIVGLTGANALGLLTPASTVGANTIPIGGAGGAITWSGFHQWNGYLLVTPTVSTAGVTLDDGVIYAAAGSYVSFNVYSTIADASLEIGIASNAYQPTGAREWIANNNFFLYYPAELRIGTGTGATPVATFATDGTIQFGFATSSLVTLTAKPASTAGIRLDPNAATGNWTLSLSPANLTANRRATFPDVGGTVAFGTGTATQLAYWSATNTLTSSANLVFDGTYLYIRNGGRLRIEPTSSTGSVLTLAGNAAPTGATWDALVVPTALTASRTYILPDAGGTFAFGTGIATHVAYWSGANLLTSDADLTFDGAGLYVGGTLGIGTTPTTAQGITITNGTNAITANVTDTGTDNVTTIVTLRHRTSSTPVAPGFGAAIYVLLHSSNNTDRNVLAIQPEWLVATDTSRTSQTKLFVFDYGGAREVLRLAANGSSSMIGFLGAGAAVRQTGGAATAGGTYGSTEQTMLQKSYDCLRTFGLLT